MGVYLSSPNTEKISADRTFGKYSYGVSSMQGWRMTQEVKKAAFAIFWTESRIRNGPLPNSSVVKLPRLFSGERGGSVVECLTPEREVRGSRPTAAVLCPWARHFTPRKYWLITQEAMAPSRHDWKIVDWDVKPQHNQTPDCLARHRRVDVSLSLVFFILQFSTQYWIGVLVSGFAIFSWYCISLASWKKQIFALQNAY